MCSKNSKIFSVAGSQSLRRLEISRSQITALSAISKSLLEPVIDENPAYPNTEGTQSDMNVKTSLCVPNNKPLKGMG